MMQYYDNVIGIDISHISIENARRSIKNPKLEKPIFLIMDAEHTTFPDNSFHAITCNGVLHHLDLDAAYKEIARILKPGGRAFCLEPLAYNPIFQLYRRMTPNLRTEWERKHILTHDGIEKAVKYGLEPCDIRYFHLFTLLAVPFRKTKAFEPMLRLMEMIDDDMLSVWPFDVMSWQIYFELRKE